MLKRMTSSEWFIVSFSMVAFHRRRHLGVCHCVERPFIFHRKGKDHHSYTTHGSHQLRLEACGVETVSKSPQTYTHMHRKYMAIANIEDISTVTACVCLSGCECVRHLKCFWCVWARLLLFSLWQLNHSPPPVPVRKLRRWLVHIFPQLYGLVPSEGTVMCFIDMLQVTL